VLVVRDGALLHHPGRRDRDGALGPLGLGAGQLGEDARGGEAVAGLFQDAEDVAGAVVAQRGVVAGGVPGAAAAGKGRRSFCPSCSFTRTATAVRP
jgi:hypothetical protein